MEECKITSFGYQFYRNSKAESLFQAAPYKIDMNERKNGYDDENLAERVSNRLKTLKTQRKMRTYCVKNEGKCG